ncbi:hypothetical protein MTO96_007399 [Rhipicephalus appendiculatus]
MHSPVTIAAVAASLVTMKGRNETAVLPAVPIGRVQRGGARQETPAPRSPPLHLDCCGNGLRAAVSEAAGTVDTAFLLEGVTSDCAVVAPFLRYGCGIRWRALRRDVHVSPRRIGHTFAAITNGLPCPSRPPGQLQGQTANPRHCLPMAAEWPVKCQLPLKSRIDAFIFSSLQTVPLRHCCAIAAAFSGVLCAVDVHVIRGSSITPSLLSTMID